MLFRKFLKKLFENEVFKFENGFVALLRAVVAHNLQHKALAQITCAHTCGVKILNNSENFQKFLFGGFVSSRKCNIVNNVFNIAAEITVLVNIADNVFCKQLLILVHYAETELRKQILVERITRRIRNVGAAVVVIIAVII